MLQSEVGVQGSAWRKPAKYDQLQSGHLDFSIEGLFERARDLGIYFVYPDAGAEKRYRKQIKYPYCISCCKERDFNSGAIKRITVNESMLNPDMDTNVGIIVDDLCSKGGTFLGTASKLRQIGFKKIILVVTHCENTIFSGDLLTSDLVDEVVVTSSIPFDRNTTDYIKLKIKD